MADTNLTSLFTNIANAIRTKTGLYIQIPASDFPAAIRDIPTGGIIPRGEISITENGTFDVTNFASALVNVQGGGSLSSCIEVGEFTPETNLTEITINNPRNVAPRSIMFFMNDMQYIERYTYKYGMALLKSDGAFAGGSGFHSGSVTTEFIPTINTAYFPVSEMSAEKIILITRGSSYYYKQGKTYTYIIGYDEV